jgi:hypothetical protein
MGHSKHHHHLDGYGHLLPATNTKPPNSPRQLAHEEHDGATPLSAAPKGEYRQRMTPGVPGVLFR